MKKQAKSGLAAGLTKKEGFNPADSSPPSTKTGRTKHDNPKISRKASVPKM